MFQNSVWLRKVSVTTVKASLGQEVMALAVTLAQRESNIP